MGARDLLAACKRGALLSECGTFRYALYRRWKPGYKLVFVMLNPSTADAYEDDATIRRCVTFAEAEGYGAIEVVNLFAFRATKPADLASKGWQTGGKEADEAILAAVWDAKDVCVAWGAIGDRGPANDRVQQIMPLLRSRGHQPMCLRITRSGFPQHPLYLHSTCRLFPFTLEAIEAASLGRDVKGG